MSSVHAFVGRYYVLLSLPNIFIYFFNQSLLRKQTLISFSLLTGIKHGSFKTIFRTLKVITFTSICLWCRQNLVYRPNLVHCSSGNENRAYYSLSHYVLCPSSPTCLQSKFRFFILRPIFLSHSPNTCLSRGCQVMLDFCDLLWPVGTDSIASICPRSWRPGGLTCDLSDEGCQQSCWCEQLPRPHFVVSLEIAFLHLNMRLR